MNRILSTTLTTAGVAGVGAGLMYFLDPDRGRRRRALVRDKTVRMTNKAGDAVRKTACDVQNRVQGVTAQTRSLFTRNREDHSDSVLNERIRSKIGRLVSHPHSIKTSIDNGQLTLRGDVLESEVGKLIRRLSSMRGVEGVTNLLQTHSSAESIPSLQGLPSPRTNGMSPTLRLITSAAGGGLVVWGATHPGRVGTPLGTLGAAMALSGAMNRNFARMIVNR